MRIETRTTMVSDSRKVYIADDGTEFSRYIECMHYEVNVYRKQVEESKDVIECKELLHCKPFDNEEYSIDNTYRWFKPLNENGIELLNKAFPTIKLERNRTMERGTNDLSNGDIGKWYCVSYYMDGYECYWSPLSESRAYANKVLSLLDDNKVLSLPDVIVHCKDCVYARPLRDMNYDYLCHYWNGHSCNQNQFCSQGKIKMEI